jgi:hypothetical protein
MQKKKKGHEAATKQSVPCVVFQKMKLSAGFACDLHHAACLLGLFDHDPEGDMFLRNDG